MPKTSFVRSNVRALVGIIIGLIGVIVGFTDLLVVGDTTTNVWKLCSALLGFVLLAAGISGLVRRYA